MITLNDKEYTAEDLGPELVSHVERVESLRVEALGFQRQMNEALALSSFYENAIVAAITEKETAEVEA